MTQKELLKTLANMSEEMQNEFYNQIPEEDAKTIKQMVFFYKIYNNETLYKAVQSSMAEQFYNEHIA